MNVERNAASAKRTALLQYSQRLMEKETERERESCMYSCGGGKHPDIDASHNLTELSMGQQHVRKSIGVLTGVRIRFITALKQPNQDITIIPGGNNINDHHMECLRLCERMYVS